MPNNALVWDLDTDRKFETGVDHGVLFTKASDADTDYTVATPWSGLTGITETPTGAEETALYADNIKYLSLRSREEFTATINAFTYPEEFEPCNGEASLANGIKIGQQTRKPFCFAYRTKKGSAANPEGGYIIHLIYNATAAPSEKAYETVNETPAAITFSWSITTVPIEVADHNPTAHLEIDLTEVESAKASAVEALVFGTSSAGPAKFPTPADILDALK